MEPKTTKLYPSAPLMISDQDLEQRLEKKLKDVNSCNNSKNNVKDLITYFGNKNHKPKEEFKKYETLDTILESMDTIGIIGATSTSIILSITGICLVVLPLSAGISCTLSLGNKVIHKIIINKYGQYKKQYQRDQQTFKYFDKIFKNVSKIV